MTTYNDDTPSDYRDADGKILTIGEVNALIAQKQAELDKIRQELHDIGLHGVNIGDLLSGKAAPNDIKNDARILELKTRAYDIYQEVECLETASPNPEYHYTGVYEDKPF